MNTLEFNAVFEQTVGMCRETVCEHCGWEKGSEQCRNCFVMEILQEDKV